MSKRRVFDINFTPADDVPAGTKGGDARRGPMAAAIAENSEALAERAVAEAAIRAENDALAHEHVRLKKAGLIVDLIPLGKIQTRKLIRDRKAERDPEIDELKTSIRQIGLSNPIRVEPSGEVYELVQGYRRLTAYRELFEETGDARFGAIPAGLVAKGEALEALYRRMVDENLVRRDISFAEMAALAWAYLAEHAAEMSHVNEAVERLYSSVTRQKRSVIRTFAQLLGAVGDDLRHGDQIPRALGVSLVRRLEDDAQAAAALVAELRAMPARSAEAELQILRAFAAGAPAAKKPVPRSAKTTIRLARREGVARCIASDGRIDLRLSKDFSAVERDRLEAAIAAFLDTLQD